MFVHLFILAGVPARFFEALKKDVTGRLAMKYAGDRAMFTGAGAAEVTSPSAVVYRQKSIADLMERSLPYLMPSARYPRGFCPLHDKPCKLLFKGRGNCKKTDRQACRMQRPRFVTLIYHRGQRVRVLRESFTIGVHAVGFPQEVYKSKTKTAAFIEELFDGQRERARWLDQQLSGQSQSTPLLLPVRNFEAGGELKKLLESGDDTGETENTIERFRRIYWRKRPIAGFQDRRKLVFRPANERHGPPRIEDNEEENKRLAGSILGQYYRMGVLYPEGFHYDVQCASGGLEKVTLECRKKGELQVSGTHARIYPSDFVVPK